MRILWIILIFAAAAFAQHHWNVERQKSEMTGEVSVAIMAPVEGGAVEGAMATIGIGCSRGKNPEVIIYVNHYEIDFPHPTAIAWEIHGS